MKVLVDGTQNNVFLVVEPPLMKEKHYQKKCTKINIYINHVGLVVGGCLSFLTGGLTVSNNKKFTNTAFKVPCLILLVFSEVVDVPYPHENLHPGTKNKSSTILYYYIIGCSFFKMPVS